MTLITSIAVRKRFWQQNENSANISPLFSRQERMENINTTLFHTLKYPVFSETAAREKIRMPGMGFFLRSYAVYEAMFSMKALC